MVRTERKDRAKIHRERRELQQDTVEMKKKLTWSESTPAMWLALWNTDGLKVSARPLLTPPAPLLLPPVTGIRRDGGRSRFSPSSSFKLGIAVELRNGLLLLPGLGGAPPLLPLPPVTKLPTRRKFGAVRGGDVLPREREPMKLPPPVGVPRESTKLLDWAFWSFKKSRLWLFKTGEVFPGFIALSIAACD